MKAVLLLLFILLDYLYIVVNGFEAYCINVKEKAVQLAASGQCSCPFEPSCEKCNNPSSFEASTSCFNGCNYCTDNGVCGTFGFNVHIVDSFSSGGFFEITTVTVSDRVDTYVWAYDNMNGTLVYQ
jgi:hypothetical protein